MQSKFKEGDLVRNRQFGELQQIVWVSPKKVKGEFQYKVKSLEGPGPYGGYEYWYESQLKYAKKCSKCDDTKEIEECDEILGIFSRKTKCAKCNGSGMV